MKNKYDDLLDRLLLAARLRKPDMAAIEEHFETRLMANLAERREGWRGWSAWAWRLLPVSV